jgi:hypothetical protein
MNQQAGGQTQEERLISALRDAFLSIHNGVALALAKASTAEETESILTEYNAARDAYYTARTTLLNAADPSIAPLLAKLQKATAAVEAVDAQVGRFEDVANKIDIAVGVLAKIVAIAATVA